MFVFILIPKCLVAFTIAVCGARMISKDLDVMNVIITCTAIFFLKNIGALFYKFLSKEIKDEINESLPILSFPERDDDLEAMNKPAIISLCKIVSTFGLATILYAYWTSYV